MWKNRILSNCKIAFLNFVFYVNMSCLNDVKTHTHERENQRDKDRDRKTEAEIAIYRETAYSLPN